MNQMLYMQLAEQHREQLLREAENWRLAAQVKNARGSKAKLSPATFLHVYRQATMLFPWRALGRTPNVGAITLNESESALRTTFALMHKKGVISDYDERFMQQFTQTFERELVRQRVPRRAVAPSHV